MGLITNLIAAAIAVRYNRRHSNITTSIFGSLPDRGSVIICGGRQGRRMNDGIYELTLAEELKLDALSSYSERIRNSGRGALVLYADYHIPSPEIDSDLPVLGKNISYMPLDTSDLGWDNVYNFFSRIINSYCLKTSATKTVILDCVHMLLDLIYSSYGGEFLTFPNIKNLADALTTSAQISFQEYCSEMINREFPPEWEDFLTLRWDEIRRNFTPFWKNLCRTIDRYSAPGMKSESLYSLIFSGNICFCGLNSPDDSFRDIILSELALIHEKRLNFSLVDYYVPLSDIPQFRFLYDRTCIIIGDTLSGMGISAKDIMSPSCVCLGVNSEEAGYILRSFASSRSWLNVRLGYGSNGSYIDFSTSARTPLYESELTLQNIPDGCAMCLSPEGFEFVRCMTV